MDEINNRKVLLAYAIATYANTLQGMEALREAGVPVGYSTLGGVRRFLRDHAHQWDVTYNQRFAWEEGRLPEIVAEARAYCTDHQVEVNDLERGLTSTTERE